jgi:MFS family permease
MTQIAHAAPPRSWYHGWNIVAVCMLSQVAANSLTYNTFSLFLRDWSAQFHTPISQLHLGVSAMVLVAAFLSPVVGGLADRYPARRLFAGGLIGIALFYLSISVATAAWQILALYGILASVALDLSTAVPANALVSRWFVRRLGLALGLSAFGIGLAGVVLPPVIAALLPTAGWRMIWRGGGAAVGLLVMPLVVAVIRDRPTDTEGRYYLSGDGKKRGHHGGAAGRMGWREVVARRNFWLLVAIYLPMMGLYSGIGQNLAPYAASRGISQQSAGLLLSVLSFSHIIATLVLGLLSDRFGNRLPFAGLALAMVAGAATLAYAGALPAIVAGIALVGLGGGVFTLLAAAIAVEFGAEGVGRAFGLSMFFLPIMSLAPFVVAKAQESTGSYAFGIIGLAALVFVAGMLSLMLRERRTDQPMTLKKPTSLGGAPDPSG